MTGQPVRDPLADNLISPPNAAPVEIVLTDGLLAA
jgi:hypothetical protein